MNLFRAQFPIKDPADTVVSLNNQFFSSPVAITDLAPLFWTDTDQLDGTPTLNCVTSNEAPLKATLNNANDGDYNVTSSPVQPVEFFGSHPIHRPH